MTKYIVLEENLIKQIFTSESIKLVGKAMKRFELTENKEEIKKNVKELLYEAYRDLQDILITCNKSEDAIYLEFRSREKGKEK